MASEGIEATSSIKSAGQNVLLINLAQIVQIVDDDRCSLLGEQMKEIKILEDPEGKLEIYCVDGKIKRIGKNIKSTLSQMELADCCEIVDCQGGSVIPGLVDAHTHPVFAGDRVHEFAMKLAGASYMDVQAAGGGIHFSAEKTWAATRDTLLADFLQIAEQMLQSGTTLLEAKSGYGLTTESELKMLEVLEMAAAKTPLEISATFCGAHAIPRGKSEGEQCRLILEEMLPAIGHQKERMGRLKNTENCDVFCEKGVFELESTEQILKAAAKIGLRANFHADELFPLGGAEMGAKIGATAISHLEEISPEGIRALANAGTVAVLLPTTAYILRLKSPPVRQMIAEGVCIALGSDFNPNAFCFAMPMVMNLACVLFGLSMPEALVAATLHAAKSLGRGKSHGAISIGRMADLVVLNQSNWEHLIYRMAGHQTIIQKVLKAGKVVYSRRN